MENKELLVIKSALLGQPVAGTTFSAEDTNEAAMKIIMEKCGLNETSTARDIRRAEADVFALIEETIDEILPAKLSGVLQNFAEVKVFPRDAEVVFNIEKIGRNRAKLTISKGARAGIYRAARLDSKYFSLNTSIYTVSVFVTLEELILGTASLQEYFNNILEGFEEIVYKEVFNALASGKAVAGYDRINVGGSASTSKDALGAAIDKVMPVVKQYGNPIVFGSFEALSGLYNPLAKDAGYPNLEDSQDVRKYGRVQIYKGAQLVELPNYLVDNTNDEWFYDKKYVFVLPTGIKPVKVALKGDMVIQKNGQAVGSEKWEASKMMGVGVAMANNFPVIEITDLN